MSVASNAYTVLRLYATKKQNPEVSFPDFAVYISKYSQRYVEEQPELSPFINNTHDAVNEAIEELKKEKKILVRNEKETKIIIVTSYYRDLLILRYKEISANSAINFPVRIDMPRGFPDELIIRKEATELIYDFFDKRPRQEGLSENIIYSLAFKKELEAILVPDGFSPELLLEMAVAKIRRIMNKSGQYDYYLKKMIAANTSRDVSAKAFFTQFVNQTSMTLHNMKQGGESYYFWNQLLTFIRNDYEKIQEKMQDDTAVLQALCITEICTAYFKTKSQLALQKETALKNLDLALEKPPYYYDYNSITKFTDSRGIPLLGQFEAEDLNEYIKKSTTSADGNKLPDLLSFKPNGHERYFIFKDKVVPLVIKLCSETREKLRTSITKDWYEKLKNFKNESAMTEQAAFEKKIEQLLKTDVPIMYTLLTSSFLPIVYQEAKDAQDKAATAYKLFSANNTLLPYSELLILSRSTMLTDAKILLPLWYTIPFISFFFALFFRKKTTEKQKSKNTNKEESVVILGEQKPPKTAQKTQREAYKSAAGAVERVLVPNGSSLDVELNMSLNEWNRILEKQAKRNLTEDVNSLIRDYMRQIIRRLGPSNFTPGRVLELAETLTQNPVLQKIRDKDELLRYIQLYILQIVKTL